MNIEDMSLHESKFDEASHSAGVVGLGGYHG